MKFTKIVLDMEFDGYDFSVRGLMTPNGHVEAIRITPLGFEMKELDQSVLQDVHDTAHEALLERFNCPEMEFDV